MGVQRQPGDDPEGPAAAALEGPEQLPVPDRVGDRTAPSAVTTSASSRFAAAVPNPLEKLPNPPPSTRPGPRRWCSPRPGHSDPPWW